MRVFRGFSPLPGNWQGSIAAIGNFDGVHQGHRAVIRAAQKLARERGAKLAVITFEPHPRDVINPQMAVPRLSSLRRKLELLRGAGVEQVMILPFSKALMASTASQFLERILAGQFGLSALFAGDNFRFGAKRQGDAQFLHDHAPRHGFDFFAVSALEISGAPCSSTRVRTALSAGEIELAANLLGEPYQIIGIVRKGDQRGRDLGFPTANTYPLPAATAMPQTGIYVVSAKLWDGGGAWLPAVASLGTNPTFDGQERRLEVHILDDFSDQLYGKRLRVQFHQRLRGEERYDSVEALVAQIAKDCDQARRIHATL